MHVTERDLLAQKEYYKDQMRAAQRYQLVKLATGSKTNRRTMARALTWLGGQLADWGEDLQERYGTVVPPTVPQPR